MSEELIMPKLTLEEAPAEALAPAEAIPSKLDPVRLDRSELTKEEQALVAEFSAQIDLTNANHVLLYGAAAQKTVSDFSDSALANVRTKDLGQVGDALTGLVSEIRGFNDAADSGGFMGIFKSAKRKLSRLAASYDKIENNVGKIVGALEGHQVQLLKDVAMLDRMYDLNLQHFKELSLYIIAGEQKLDEVLKNDLPALQREAKESGDMVRAQQANDLAEMCNRFEKKLHDLKLTRQICIQMAPQIRLIQNNDSLLVEKIQSSISNTIPLWKNQMVISLGLAHSQQAMRAQREVTDMTNELLRKNSEMLKQGSIEVAREGERGIVDIETLKKTNADLISTLEEVIKIQEDGHNKRVAAEGELQNMENELKQKLLEIRDSKPGRIT